jgi:GntR family transcriptional regulator
MLGREPRPPLERTRPPLLAGDDPTPLYFRLHGILRAAFESLEYPPGSRLPPERILAKQYSVSRITVRQALDGLEQQGLVRRDRGRLGGTFVCEASNVAKPGKLSGSFDALFSRRQIKRIDIRAFDTRASNAEIAGALHLSVSAPVRYVERILNSAEGPIAYVRNFLPWTVGRQLTRRHLKQMLLQETLTKLGVKLVEVRDEIEAALSDSQTAALLDVSPGSPLLAIRRVFVAAADEPVNLTRMLIVSARYRMTVTLRPQATVLDG